MVTKLHDLIFSPLRRHDIIRVPKFVRNFFWDCYVEYVKPILNHINPDAESSKASASHMFATEQEGSSKKRREGGESSRGSNDVEAGKDAEGAELGPAFAMEVPTDTGIDEMLAVIQHPRRSKILDALAEKTLTTENLEFIRAVLAYEEEAQGAMVVSTGQASDVMKEKAEKLYAHFVKQNCEREVNVSSSTRVKVEKALKVWYVLNHPLPTPIEREERVIA